jgi:hypothetical protein
VEAPGYLRIFDRLRWVVAAILSSPFHWPLSCILMLLGITGRKTGRRYTIPVAYHQADDAIIVMVADAAHRSWWRNFREPGPIELHLRGSTVAAHAELLSPESAEFQQRAEQAFRRAAFVGRIFGVRFDPAVGLTTEQQKVLGEYAAVLRITPEARAVKRRFA